MSSNPNAQKASLAGLLSPRLPINTRNNNHLNGRVSPSARSPHGGGSNNPGGSSGSSGGGFGLYNKQSNTINSYGERSSPSNRSGGGQGYHYGGNSPMGGGGSSSSQASRNGGRVSLGRGMNGPPSPSAVLSGVMSVAGEPLACSETNMDWTKLNIFRTRLCDRLLQSNSCHMANRCLFSHDVTWPRRTPFLPRATALTLRYIPAWCPRVAWPPLLGICDSMGKISWTSTIASWDPEKAHKTCMRGDNCPFVHNLEELLYHPEVYKTTRCCLASGDSGAEEAAVNGSCVALCPWYFCPFAHDQYEQRDIKNPQRCGWHPPPQIVDNHFVARTQGFDEVELSIIEFIRKSPGGSLDLYRSANSPLRKLWRDRLPPVFRPLPGSSLERLLPSQTHAKTYFDDLTYFLIIASLKNLVLYPVENFYVPALLSLQCAVLQYQLDDGRLPYSELDCKTLLQEYDRRYGEVDDNNSNNANTNTTTLPPGPGQQFGNNDINNNNNSNNFSYAASSPFDVPPPFGRMDPCSGVTDKESNIWKLVDFERTPTTEDDQGAENASRCSKTPSAHDESTAQGELQNLLQAVANSRPPPDLINNRWREPSAGSAPSPRAAGASGQVVGGVPSGPVVVGGNGGVPGGYGAGAGGTGGTGASNNSHSPVGGQQQQQQPPPHLLHLQQQQPQQQQPVAAASPTLGACGYSMDNSVAQNQQQSDLDTQQLCAALLNTLNAPNGANLLTALMNLVSQTQAAGEVSTTDPMMMLNSNNSSPPPPPPPMNRFCSTTSSVNMPSSSPLQSEQQPSSPDGSNHRIDDSAQIS